MNLGQWAEQFNVIDSDGSHTARVRLVTGDDECWHTWDASELRNVEQWQQSVQVHMAGLADNLGKGRHQVLLVAEDHSGNIRSKWPASVLGRNTKQESKGSEITALVAGMDSLARTMRSMLDMQTELLQKQQEFTLALAEKNRQLVAELDEERESKGGDELTQTVLANLGQQLGPILQALPDLMQAYAHTKRGLNVVTPIGKTG